MKCNSLISGFIFSGLFPLLVQADNYVTFVNNTGKNLNIATDGSPVVNPPIILRKNATLKLKLNNDMKKNNHHFFKRLSIW
ncbi:hypothetical protein BGC07_17145 [Piscirickettsia litoralis]|uniref:Plastocyanin-like domain-containing protein n=1 Tax=Piscirickettsia litoralis TaxID=1891921 RepID=A0ABX2ZY31_9GAMM|nr:hypothetical protein BGC07_17145 [Piscirickettsia litoralis]